MTDTDKQLPPCTAWHCTHRGQHYHGQRRFGPRADDLQPGEVARKCGGCGSVYAGPPSMLGACCPRCRPNGHTRPLRVEAAHDD